MNEYISKHDAYTTLKDLEAAYIYPPVKEAYATAARRIDEIKAADVQPVDRWISVNDRLPEEEGDVLVWIVDGKPDGIHHLESEYIANWEYGNFYDGDWNVINGITHWQPLPEPPKEGY